MLVFAPQASANSKYAAYVVHADSGDVLFDRYSTSRRYPASLTKMMTLYLLFEALEDGELALNSKIKVSARAAGQPPSKLGVSSGSSIDVETAIRSLVIKSANDIAVAVAEELAGSEWRFAQEMTAKARELSMYNTTFRNASGLPNRKMVTTARDMAVLGRRVAQDFPQYFHYFGEKSFTWDGRTYRTHNSLVKTFDGADGLKTGYTRRSGFNLVTSATRDGQRLIGVVLGGRSSRTRDAHMRDILDDAFGEISKKPTLIAALHRKKPSPRLKPTLVAALAQKNTAPTVAGNEDLRAELMTAAAVIEGGDAPAPAMGSDGIGDLIARADTDDFNEFERAKLASLYPADPGYIGEGDLESVMEFGWSIQIGAYSNKELAQKELEKAVRKVGLDFSTMAILPTPLENGKTLYRARVTKLSEIDAATACETLKDKKVSCFVVSDQSALQGAPATTSLH
ncbi:D-alanyl-D-alanine carboxypeptidase [Hyphococcus flavus]|uniref:D-alanyl-D-alanine carboxypeptidase n=1 Tax=Hyphococcus flavus TaxID=1866326 RepID=A0AAE9ZEU6_9PROT|nr:D-alanyl-D-alanine carboxypeptidase [Hyphococcus flavus]WDI31367.1 D-alanyl-D-alanine carboxypeptidase [Hyphococcus flavus]